MKEKLVPSTWLEKEGRRLDCGPYLSGAVEAKVLLEELPVTKKQLQQVTEGGLDGIFHAGRHGRTYVSDADYGVPFLSSSDVLLADFACADLISKKQAAATPEFILRKDWTLITRSGTIGRMAYARSDMEGLACSEHILRVLPDAGLIAPGYLFAFLSSRFGVPLVVGGTYGSIIQSIEPQHVAELPVPMAPPRIQDAAHKLVEEAAKLRSNASTELRLVIRDVEKAAGLPVLERRYDGESPDISVVKSGSLGGRMDGLFHSNYHSSVLEPLLKIPKGGRATVDDLADRIFEPARFKRIPVEDPQYGVPFFGTSALMRAEPEASYLITKRTSGIADLMISRTSILIPRSGQLVGLIGHAVLPHGDILGGAVSEDAIRVEAPDESTAGFLFACLSSEYGRRQLKARAFGSSIPHLDVRMIGGAIIPKLDDQVMKNLGTRAFGVATDRHQAVTKEREARTLVENWIVKKGGA